METAENDEKKDEVEMSLQSLMDQLQKKKV